jgi:hypothetical protein
VDSIGHCGVGDALSCVQISDPKMLLVIIFLRVTGNLLVVHLLDELTGDP